MKKGFILSSCSTCQRILDEIGWKWELQNIKEDNIDAQTLDKLKDEHGSYENLFSKRAMKYRGMGLHNMDLTEKDYRRYIIEEYTFLKRPVFIIGDRSFVGNTKKVVEELKAYLSNG